MINGQPYISIDIETLGLNPNSCNIIEIAAVIDFDGRTPIEELPKFESYITHEAYCGEPFALQMNAEILKEIASLDEKQRCNTRPDYVVNKFSAFLATNLPKGVKNYTPAGKNFAGFDKGFLEKLPNYKDWIGRMLGHRTIDPGNLFWEPYEDGLGLPDTKLCLLRAGLEPTNSHRALGDAIDVVRLIRFQLEKRGGLLEWSKDTKQNTDKCIIVKEVKMPEKAQEKLDIAINEALMKFKEKEWNHI